MYCDYEALEEYSSDMSRKFNDMMSLLDSIDKWFNKASSVSNLDSSVGDYFTKQYGAFQENYDIIISKFNNIKSFLENVAENYRRMDF